MRSASVDQRWWRVARVIAIAAGVFASAGCSGVRDAWCQVDFCRPDGCSSWDCQFAGASSRYELDCGSDGGTSCVCIHDGTREKVLPAPPWTTNDCFERIDDVNAACGWSMSTCGI